MARQEGEDLRFDDRMTDLEALLWGLETRRPALGATITAVVTFDRPPDAGAVSERVEWLSRRLPRLRQRVAASVVPTAPPRWEADPDFDLHRHLVTVPAAGPVCLDTVLRAAEAVATRPFDRDHPLWQMFLVGGPDGGAALIVKLHHTFTDGLGAVKLAAELFDLQRQAPTPATPFPPSSQGQVPGFGRMWEDLAFEARRTADVVGRLLPWAAGAVRDAALDPQPRAQSTFDLVESVRALAASAGGPGSEILAGRSTGVRFGALTIPLAELRRAASRAGGTVNDVFLAAVLGGLRQYHIKRGTYPPSLRIGIPISTRGADTEADMRNQFAPMLVRAPLQLTDPVERIRLLHELVLAARHQPALELLEPAAGLLRRTPGFLQLVARLAGSADLMASNVPGSPVELYLGGAQVEQLVALGPRGGAGLNLTLLSHVGAVRVGVNMDPVSIPEPGVLLDCLQSGFDETLA